MSAEQRIKAYFANVAIIEEQHDLLKYIDDCITKIRADIVSTNIVLHPEWPPSSYIVERVQVSYSGSNVEHQLDQIIGRMERQIQILEKDRLDAVCEIRRLEIRNKRMDYVLNRLNPEESEFLKLRYRDGRSIDSISVTMSMSPSSVKRLKIRVLRYISDHAERMDNYATVAE